MKKVLVEDIEAKIAEHKEEIQKLYSEIEHLEGQRVDKDMYEDFKNVGETLKLCHDAFMDVGFSDDQAFELMLALM